MLKFESSAEVGDVIKGYDFEPLGDRPESYVIGKVIAKGKVPPPYFYRAYTILVENDSGVTEEKRANRVGCEVFVPFETAFLDWDGRIVVLEKGDE